MYFPDLLPLKAWATRAGVAMAGKTLICGTNWLGDAVMSVPAVRAFKRSQPDLPVTVLVKQKLVPLWQMQGAVDSVKPLLPGVAGTWRTARRLEAEGFEQAFVLPNSFRSGLIPWLAGIPVRNGARGHWRAWMLNRLVTAPLDGHHGHQACETFRLLGLETPGPDAPELDPSKEAWLHVPGETMRRTTERWNLDAPGDLVGLMPGAARGPAKRWPAERFVEVGKWLAREHGCRVIVLGTDAESALCRWVAAEVGCDAVNAAGQTSMPELAAVLGACRLVLGNDSGGLHLAAACGTPVVAVFGLTDPDRTAPLGRGHRIVRAEGVAVSRDISRCSEAARRALLSIATERVIAAAQEVLLSEGREA